VEDYEIAIREEIYCASDRERKSRERTFKYLLREAKIGGTQLSILQEEDKNNSNLK
jgi:hypothetical protein